MFTEKERALNENMGGRGGGEGIKDRSHAVQGAG
jgi:hypothetical protein